MSRSDRTKQLDLTETWRSYSMLDQQFFDQLQSKVYVFSDSVLCLGGQCHPHPISGEVWEKSRESLVSLQRQSIAISTTSVNQSCSIGGFTKDTQRFSFSPRSAKCSRARKCIRTRSKDGLSSCRGTTTKTGTRSAMKMYANKTQLMWHPMSKYF